MKFYTCDIIPPLLVQGIFNDTVSNEEIKFMSHKEGGGIWLAERLLASQEALCCTELVACSGIPFWSRKDISVPLTKIPLVSWNTCKLISVGLLYNTDVTTFHTNAEVTELLRDMFVRQTSDVAISVHVDTYQWVHMRSPPRNTA
jgi:hypothetical protein